MIGNALGLVTPMRAGDLGRALYFSKGDRPKIVALTVMDRLIDLTIVFILAVLGSLIVINTFFGLFIILLSLISIFILYYPAWILNIFIRITPVSYVREKLVRLLDMVEILSRRRTLIALILSLTAFLTIIIEFYYLISAFSKVGWIPICLVTPLITLSTIIPVSIMGLGVREGLSIALFSLFGVSANAALSAAFLLFLINNVSISIIGVHFFSKTNLLARKNTIYSVPSTPASKDADTLK
jgi:uncharacterized protein (TIRG00374 family)